MNFQEIVQNRQSCRSYDESRAVEPEKLEAILAAVRLSPSACNGQPYHLTVCQGETAKKAAAACMGAGMNKFASQAPVTIVISEENYVRSAAVGARLKHNDYRSIDIGIAAAHLTLAATELGLGTCILGWINDSALREVCGLTKPARLVITLGYPKADDHLRSKKRKQIDELVTYL